MKARAIAICGAFLPALGQDLFLASGVYDTSNKSDAHDARNTTSSSQLMMGTTANILTFSPIIDPNVCLDFRPDEDKIQVWECNGHQRQLWYFNPGSYAIQWGGDSTKCIDAGQGMKKGNQVFLWGCNGSDQQKWAYDSNTKTVYLANSPSTKMCLDLKTNGDDGTLLWIWNCDGWRNQQWFLTTGITIRSQEHWTFCLDTDSRKTDDGTKVLLWSCHSGIHTQKWFFDSKSYQLRSAADSSKCLDAGKNAAAGSLPYLWDCNGEPQQQWGYDSSEGKLYLAASDADASLCLDISGGNIVMKGKVQLWQCGGCWNQLWSVIGPVSDAKETGRSQPSFGPALRVPTPKAARGFLHSSANMKTEETCPARHVFGHCFSGDQYGWPVFNDENALKNDGPWSQYFQTVYGGIPSVGYPICTYNFALLYTSVVEIAKIQTPSQLIDFYPKNWGAYYNEMGFYNKEIAWIWNPILSHPLGGSPGNGKTSGLPGSTWVEVTHVADPQDATATWLYYAPGTAVWFFLGNTRIYNTHTDCIKELLGQDCKVLAGDYHDECETQFEDMYTAAKSHGLDSLQFLFHDDMPGGTSGWPNNRGNLAIEIVDLLGVGTDNCGGPTGYSRFRAGWEALDSCYCDNSARGNMINCKGYGIWR